MRRRNRPIRREQLRVLLVVFPTAAVTFFLIDAVGSVSEHPILVPLLLLPLIIVVAVLGYPLVKNRRLVLGGGFLPFFVAYCLLFSIAAGANVLEGPRARLAGFEDQAPSNVLGLSRLGDWHYWFAPHPPPMNDIVVVALPSFSGGTTEEARRTQADLIARAVAMEAEGIAFDYFLEESSRADRILCFQIGEAAEAGIPVLYGYRVVEGEAGPVRRLPAAEIRDCVGDDNFGALTGLREADGRVRIVPTTHMGDPELRTLSWRAAALLAGGDEYLPSADLVRFVPPEDLPFRFDSVPTREEAQAFRDRFIMVGSSRSGDVQATPFDSLPGVVIHALAAHNLRTDTFLRRLDYRWIFPLIFLLCYILTLIQASGGGARALWLGVGVFALGILLSAGLAARAGFWVDASYPLLAVGGMGVVLTGGARLHRGRSLTVPPPASVGKEKDRPGVEARPFDVFVSYNSRDRTQVLEVAEGLRERGLRVWIDQWEMVPGRTWQDALEETIATVASAAIMIGPDGMGSWEEPEMRACLDQSVNRDMPLLPVLLPGTPTKPKLSLFLSGFTWVDLRGGITREGLDRLEWGITGIRPRGRVGNGTEPTQA